MNTHNRTLRPATLTLAASMLVATLGLGGCNNAGEGALSGAALGAGGGAIIGSLYGGAGTGAAIGAVAGALGGALIGDQNARNASAPRYGYSGGYGSSYGGGGGYYTEYREETRYYYAPRNHGHCRW